MKIKAGAKVNGLKVEILLALVILEGIFKGFGVDVVITEGTGGIHRDNSLHYQGLAVDIRSKGLMSEVKQQILREAISSLGQGYDMLLEDEGTENEHFHVEYDFRL